MVEIVGGLLRVMIAMGTIGHGHGHVLVLVLVLVVVLVLVLRLGPMLMRVRAVLHMITAGRVTMAVHVIMAVRVSAIACHMAYRGTPIRLRLPP
ncbi:hypothetical protein [Streptomyces sp. NPDC048637]|uniref:hypothetical protein n=1 Tax=Streptomyces sp. NPDC048637 TaxID=3155636 RepID=UPI00343EA89D